MKITVVQGDTQGKGKGRIFAGDMATFITWNGSGAKTGIKDSPDPIYMDIVGTEGQLRPLIANMRTGRTMALGDGLYRSSKTLTLAKAAPLVWPKMGIHPSGALQVAYVPDLFDLECGMIHESHVTFVCMPPVSWVRDNARPLTKNEMTLCGRMGLLDRSVILSEDLAHDRGWNPRERSAQFASPEWLAEMITCAVQFCARLDTRTNYPLLPDPMFKFLVMIEFMRLDMIRFLLPHTGAWPTGDLSVERYKRAVLGGEKIRDSEGAWQPSPPRYYGAWAFYATHEQMAACLPRMVKFWDAIRS